MKNKFFITTIILLLLVVITLIIINKPKSKVEEKNLNLVSEKKTVLIKKPKIELEADKYDFGIVKLTDMVSHDFLIKNTGSLPLEIQRLSTSCGCTSAEMLDDIKTIAPGNSAKIRVSFDPSVHKDNPDLGDIKRIVYIKTNDSINPEVEIEISANVIK